MRKGVKNPVHRSVVDGTHRPQTVPDKTKRTKADRRKEKARLKKLKDEGEPQ